MISIDDFKKVEIRMGKILSAERMPDSDKLLKLSVDLGEEKPRQILAGIAEHTDNPEDLVGKTVPFVINLEPRRMRGEISEGMMLAVSEDGKSVLLHPAENVSPGAIVQ